MGVGNFIMKSRDNSANNLSNILDKSANTNSTYETPKRNSAKLVLNPSFSSRREPLIKKRLSLFFKKQLFPPSSMLVAPPIPIKFNSSICFHLYFQFLCQLYQA